MWALNSQYTWFFLWEHQWSSDVIWRLIERAGSLSLDWTLLWSELLRLLPSGGEGLLCSSSRLQGGSFLVEGLGSGRRTERSRGVHRRVLEQNGSQRRRKHWRERGRGCECRRFFKEGLDTLDGGMEVFGWRGVREEGLERNWRERWEGWLSSRDQRTGWGRTETSLVARGEMEREFHLFLVRESRLEWCRASLRCRREVPTQGPAARGWGRGRRELSWGGSSQRSCLVEINTDHNGLWYSPGEGAERGRDQGKDSGRSRDQQSYRRNTLLLVVGSMNMDWGPGGVLNSFSWSLMLLATVLTMLIPLWIKSKPTFRSFLARLTR